MSGVIGRKSTHIIFDMDALLNKRKTVKRRKGRSAEKRRAYGAEIRYNYGSVRVALKFLLLSQLINIVSLNTRGGVVFLSRRKIFHSSAKPSARPGWETQADSKRKGGICRGVQYE